MPGEVIATRPTWEELRSSDLWRLADPIEVVRFRAAEGGTEVRLTARSAPDTELSCVVDPSTVVVGAVLRLPRTWLDSGPDVTATAIELSTSFLAFLGGADPPVGNVSLGLARVGAIARRGAGYGGAPATAGTTASSTLGIADPSLTSVTDLLFDPFPGEFVVHGLRLLRVNNSLAAGRWRFQMEWGTSARLPGDTARYRCASCAIEILGEQVLWDEGPWHLLEPPDAGSWPVAGGDFLRRVVQQRPNCHGPVSVVVPAERSGVDSGTALERRALLQLLDSLVPERIMAAGGGTSRRELWRRRTELQSAVVARFGAGSREHARTLVLLADSCDPTEVADSLPFYEWAAELLHRVEGETSSAVADVYARLSSRRAEAGRLAGGGLASADVLKEAAAELTVSIEIRERLIDGRVAARGNAREAPGLPGGDVSRTQLARDKQELARLRRLVAYKAWERRTGGAGR